MCLFAVCVDVIVPHWSHVKDAHLTRSDLICMVQSWMNIERHARVCQEQTVTLSQGTCPWVESSTARERNGVSNLVRNLVCACLCNEMWRGVYFLLFLVFLCSVFWLDVYAVDLIKRVPNLRPPFWVPPHLLASLWMCEKVLLLPRCATVWV